jgi:hypothetical protein
MVENFALANRVRHLIVQPSDAALDPPESYLFVQDGLIISCGVIYALCYLFCMIRAYSDRTLPGKDWGSIQFLLAFLVNILYIRCTNSVAAPDAWLTNSSTLLQRQQQRTRNSAF